MDHLTLRKTEKHALEVLAQASFPLTKAFLAEEVFPSHKVSCTHLVKMTRVKGFLLKHGLIEESTNAYGVAVFSLTERGWAVVKNLPCELGDPEWVV